MVAEEESKIWQFPNAILLDRIKDLVLDYLPDTEITLFEWEFINIAFEILQARERKFNGKEKLD